MPPTNTASRIAKPTEKHRKLYDERGLYLEVFKNGLFLWIGGKPGRVKISNRIWTLFVSGGTE
jgi:hypothetical protein